MFCKYCNADLKPSDKICPVCEKPINDLGENVNEVDNACENIEEIDSALFAPLESSEDSVEKQQSVQGSITEEVKIQEEINNDYVQIPLGITEASNVTVNQVEKKRESKNPMTFVPYIILIFAVVMFIFGFIVSHSPKVVFNTFINKAYNQINTNVVSAVDNVKGKFTLETNISTEDESLNTIFEIINNIYIGAEYEVDYEKETFLTKINTKYAGEKLLDAEVYVDDNNGYILLKDVYDKYLSTKIDGIEEIFEKAEIGDDHKIIISEVKKALTKSLKNEYFTKEKANIIINDKNISTTKNSLVLTEELTNNIQRDIIVYLKENNKFITSLSDILEINKDEILNEMDEILKSLDSEITEYNNTKVTISIYTKGLMSEVVKFDVQTEEVNEKSIVEFIKNSKDSYSIKITSAETTINGKIKLLDNEKVEFSLTEPTSGTTIGITVNYSVEYNTSLTNVDVSNRVSIESLTEEDYNTMMTKLMENKGIQNLISAINALGFSNDFDNIN